MVGLKLGINEGRRVASTGVGVGWALGSSPTKSSVDAWTDTFLFFTIILSVAVQSSFELFSLPIKTILEFFILSLLASLFISEDKV